jgi:hypothetical protein
LALHDGRRTDKVEKALPMHTTGVRHYKQYGMRIWNDVRRRGNLQAATHGREELVRHLDGKHNRVLLLKAFFYIIHSPYAV